MSTGSLIVHLRQSSPIRLSNVPEADYEELRSELKLDSEPWAVEVRSGNRILVTLVKQQILGVEFIRDN